MKRAKHMPKKKGLRKVEPMPKVKSRAKKKFEHPADNKLKKATLNY